VLLPSGIAGTTFASTSEIDGVKSRVALIDINSLRLYENPDSHRVAEIAQSLERTGRLIDPVIVDHERRILVDGHHRVRAFQWLGKKQIAAYLVDYWSEGVEVKGWSRTTDAPSRIVAREFENSPGHGDGHWGVQAIDPEGRLVARRVFTDPVVSAQYVQHVTCRLEVKHFCVNLGTPLDALGKGLVHIFSDPIIGKADVVETVERGRLFPHEVNRHLIAGRPLELGVPMRAMTDEGSLRHFLDSICAEGQSLSIPSGHQQGSRVYEERVTLFRRTNGEI
jgi:ParB-like nuclease domain